MAKITGVSKHGIARQLGIRAGDELVGFDGFCFTDILDYEYYDQQREFVMTVRGRKGEIDYEIEKDDDETLGLELDESAEIVPIRCKNKCKFCFVDQLPPGMRETLYVKDDDYRLSFISGNYITLTNVEQSELERIARLRLSPLYLSVHASDPSLKTSLIGNPRGAATMEKLRFLAENQIAMHAQIVMCPNINDGDDLMRTLGALAALRPQMRTVAVVPVGLTAHRDRLAPLTPVSCEIARDTIARVEAFQKEAGGSFVWCSDEFYAKANLPLPDYLAYGDFMQIENGVGLVRAFEYELEEALQETELFECCFEVTCFTGVSFEPYLRQFSDKARKVFPRVKIEVCAVKNRFFGESITVAGLVTPQDIIAQYAGKTAKYAVIPSTMLREFTETFLDGTTVADLEKALNTKIYISDGGGSFVNVLAGLAREEQTV